MYMTSISICYSEYLENIGMKGEREREFLPVLLERERERRGKRGKKIIGLLFFVCLFGLEALIRGGDL